jgi:hypothetical protein
MTTDTPRTDAERFEALRSSAFRWDCIPLKLGQELERELNASQAEVERLQRQLTRAVSIAGVLLADIEDFLKGDSDDEWTRNGWNDSRISKSLLQKLTEEMTNDSTN